MTIVKNKLLNPIYKTARLFRLPFYYRPQTYRASYTATVTNISSSVQKKWVAFPVAKTFFNQTITNLHISRKGTVRTEPLHNNTYFTTDLTLNPKQTITINQTFTARIDPIQQHTKNLPKKPSRSNKKHHNRFIHTQSKEIIQFAQAIEEKKESWSTIIDKAYTFVKKRLVYGDPIEGLYSVDEALSRTRVDCGGFVTLFCSLLEACSIDCLPVFGFFSGHKKNTMHAWAVIVLPNNKILPFDPSSDILFSSASSTKSGGFGWIGSDHVMFSLGCDFPIIIDERSVSVDILQNAFLYPKNKDITVITNFETIRQ